MLMGQPNRLHPLYPRWKEMRTRCSNPRRRDYKWYGGRGIKVCSRWNSFANFVADMFPSFHPGLLLDRKKWNGNYTPENCRWVTWKAQQNNRSDNARHTFRGETLTRAEWSIRTGVAKSLIKDRIRRGWSTAAALTTPLLKTWSRHKNLERYADTL